MQTPLRLMLLALLPMLCACSSTLNHPMDCNKVLQLRLGQTPDEVRALLGEPDVVGTGPVKSPSLDMFTYGSGGGVGTYRVIDHVDVNFVDRRLHLALAERNTLIWQAGRWQTATALLLGSRDGSPIHTIGPSFPQVFGCAADFSLERAVRESGYWTLSDH